jgi:hypothetical protein
MYRDSPLASHHHHRVFHVFSCGILSHYDPSELSF